jgi:UDP-glucose 4-epimerase
MIKKNVLITGGAGYIGSHMVRQCIDFGYTNIVVLDDLTTGFEENIPQGIKLVIGDIANESLVAKLLTENKIEAVFHFAASIEVEESVNNPTKYFHNNTAKTLSLINNLIEHKIKYFIFSSTAAIFGNPQYSPVDEAHPKNPLSPYGKSKLIVEEALLDTSKAHKWFRFGCLRYFNVAGCDIENKLGVRNRKIKSLIPRLAKYAVDSRNKFSVFGKDYGTKDGTCVRDFVSVYDICNAHLKLLDYLTTSGKEHFFNLGSGSGYTILEIIRTMEGVIGKKLAISYEERRDGDISEIVADSKKSHSLLNWKAKISLKEMLNSSYHWEKYNADDK